MQEILAICFCCLFLSKENLYPFLCSESFYFIFYRFLCKTYFMLELLIVTYPSLKKENQSINQSINEYICQNTENQNVLCADPEIVIQRDQMTISASGRLGEMI